jgi:branched-chain amino acid transport system substrate-binding protein
MHKIIVLSTLTFIIQISTLKSQSSTSVDTKHPVENKELQKENQPTENSVTISQKIATVTISGREEIPIGSSLPLKGEVSVIGLQIFDGMNLYFNKLKKSLTTIPFMYSLDVLDDHAKILNIRKNIDALKKKSPLFISLYGSDSVDCLLEEQGNDKPLILFPLDGSSMHRSEAYKNLIFFRASHIQEINALVDYAINELKEERFAVFYEASPWGEDARNSARSVLKKYNQTPLRECSYQQHTINVSQAVNEIAAKAPDVVLCIAQSRPAYNFIRQLVNRGLYETVFLGLSSLITIQTPLKRSRGINVITSSVVPDPKRSTLQIAKEYRDDLKKYEQNKTPSSFSFEGYINAALLAETTKLVKFPFTPIKLLEKLETLKKVRFKGLVLNFDSTTRSLSQQVWINIDEDTEWEINKPKTQSSLKETKK